jgi:large subunit ribosomal protein L20
MTRVRGGFKTKRRHNKVLALAKGYRLSRRTNIKRAQEAVLRAGNHIFEGRKLRKRDMRSLWISRISAGLFESGVNYSTFINGLKKLNILLNRKVLAEMAVTNNESFNSLVSKVKELKK